MSLKERLQNLPLKGVDPKNNEKTISYSQYSVWRQCKFRWGLEYRDKKKLYLPSMPAIFGTAIHETIQQYFALKYEISLKEANNLDLIDFFKTKLINGYKKGLETNNNVHFSTAKELNEYFEDGVNILTFFKDEHERYFDGDYELLGIEIPLVLNVNPLYDKIYLKGFLDLVFYDHQNKRIKIYDLKTSYKAWSDEVKKDDVKKQQLILYKIFFAKQLNVEVEDIDVEFIIMKRKVYSGPDFTPKRFQSFVPSAGKNSMNKANRDINQFITESFNVDGSYKDTIYPKNPSPSNCLYCSFKNDKSICDKDVVL